MPDSPSGRLARRLVLESARLRGGGARRGDRRDPGRLHRRTSSPPPTRTARPPSSSSPPRSRGRSTSGALRPLLPDLRLLVTGGIAPDGVRPWLDAGALAVGLGSNLGTAATDGADEVERRCRAALAAAS